MAQIARNVKGKFEGMRDRASNWLVCHPKTIGWLIFWLAMNWAFDLIRVIAYLFS